MIYCHACCSLTVRDIGISQCPRCSNTQLVLPATVMQKSYEGEIGRIHLSSLQCEEPAPWLVRQPGFSEKHGANTYQWGAPWVHLNSRDHRDWLLIYPIFRLGAGKYLYHGTALGRISSIGNKGLLPGERLGYQAHGLWSEKEYRYAGLDRTPAERHAFETTLELTYGGWIAHTGLPIGTDAFRTFFGACRQINADVHAIRYFEDGNSVAFAATATDICLADTRHNKRQAIRAGLSRCGILRYVEFCGR